MVWRGIISGQIRGRRAESTPLPETRFGREHLDIAIGWLLRANRLMGAEQELRSLSHFARTAAVLEGEPLISTSRVSRWETGVHPVPHSVVVRYERLLRAPVSALVSTVDVLHRFFAEDITQELGLARRMGPLDPTRHRELAATVERVHTDEVVTGQQWDDFTAFVATTPHVVLPRPSTAAEMARRLLAEMVVADGLGWQQRYEAFCRLMAHPVFGVDAVHAVAELGSDPRNQVGLETVGTLDASAHPDAATHVLRQLLKPTSEDTFRGALLACVRKSQFGHFSTAHVFELGPVLQSLVTDDGVDPATRRLALRVLAHLRHHPRTRSAIAEFALPPGRAVPAGDPELVAQGQATVQAIRAEVDADPLVGNARFVDRTMPPLLLAAVLDPVPDQRLCLTMLLRASPYRAPLAEAVTRRLGSPLAMDLRRALLTISRVLGSAEQAGPVGDLALDRNLDPVLRTTAARAMGHLGTPIGSEFWDTAVQQVLYAPAAGRPAAEEGVGAGIVYSLGVAGGFDRLAGLDRDRLRPHVAEAVGWWLDRPACVIASVRQDQVHRPNETHP